MNGGSSEGGETTESIGDIVEYLKKSAANGIAVNGILVWIDVQQHTTPPEVWQAQAIETFCDDEVDFARTALWKAVGPRKDVIGDIVAHKSPGKKRKNLQDIHKAMTILNEQNVLPMLLCSSPMIGEFPAFHCDSEKMTFADVVSKIKVVENSLGAFMKQNSEQMKALNDTIVTLNVPPRQAPMVMNPAARHVRTIQGTGSSPSDLIDLGTPGKKRKIGEDGTGIPPLAAPSPSFLNVASRNMPPASRQQLSNASAYTPRGPSQRRNSTIVYGSSRANGNLELAADVNLVASGVSRDATPDQLKSFLISRGLRVTDIELLTNFRRAEARSFSYRIAIKADDYEKALNADIWPHRVGVRLFKNRRNFLNHSSWASQSAQTGGNVVPSYQNHHHSSRSTHVQSVHSSSADAVEKQNRFDVPGFAHEVLN